MFTVDAFVSRPTSCFCACCGGGGGEFHTENRGPLLKARA